MATRSFAQILSDAELMADATKAHEAELKAVGLPEGAADEVKKIVDALNTLNKQQEKLKADLKSTTTEMTRNQAELEKKVADMRKRIKLAIAQEQWREFGISDKK